MLDKKIGIIGFGNMGQAIANQLKKDYKVYCFDKDSSKTKEISGIKVAKNTIDLVKSTDLIILAVKPQDFFLLLEEIKTACSKDKLFISIAAGITTEYIEKVLGTVKVIRAMPNIPLVIGKGMTCLTKGKFANEEDFKLAQDLFDQMGKTLRIEENLMDAACAVSGSGPAYICRFLESESIDLNNIYEPRIKEFLNKFQKAAQNVGFSQKEAAFLVETTYSGTVTLLKKTKISTEELRKQVTSRGGTTEAAFKILDVGGSWEEAVIAAKKRAEELSKKE
jgi:pyrroline-5-carboxylate reductase